MLHTVKILMKLYGPALLAVLCFVFCLTVSPGDQAAKATLHLGVVDLQLPIKNVLVLRGLLSLGVLLFLASYLCIDFSDLFPRGRLTMEVFFDNEGIAGTLADYTADELEALKVPPGYEHEQRSYFDYLDTELRGPVGLEDALLAGGTIAHSHGSATFVVKKVTGIQSYHIEESTGELLHTLERPGTEPIAFWSYFDKMPSVHDSLSVSILKVLLRGTILIRPTFRQIISKGVRADGREVLHTLCGVTKVRILPFPKIGRTLYLYEHKERGALIPVAYAVCRDRS